MIEGYDAYEYKHLIGKGSFSEIVVATRRSDATDVAVKITKSENKAWRDALHPNIIGLYDSFAKDGLLYFVMPLVAGGDLCDILRQTGGLDPNLARALFLKIASAVEYLHGRGIAHRDIKLENVLLDVDCKRKSVEPRLCDFDFALHLKQGEMVDTVCGSMPYCAPEVLMKKPHDPVMADRWSLGVLLFALVAGHTPFHSDQVDGDALLHKICGASYKIPENTPDDLAALISALLQVNPEKRPSVSSVKRGLQVDLRKVDYSPLISATVTRRQLQFPELEVESSGSSSPGLTAKDLMYMNWTASDGFLFCKGSEELEGYLRVPGSPEKERRIK